MRPIDKTIGLTPSDAVGVCAAQSTTGAGELNLSDGSLSASSGVARLGNAAQIVITCAADETARTFTIYGYLSNGYYYEEKLAGVNGTTATSTNSFREVFRVAIDGAGSGNVSVGVSGSAEAISTAAQPASASNLTLDGVLTYEATMYGIAENGKAATVKIVSAGADSGVTFTIYGQDENLVDISEDVTGVDGATATSVDKFKKVYAIYADGLTADDITVGWAGDTDGIAKAQTLSGAGYVTMNGVRCGIQARHVSITSAGSDESGVTFTVVGLNRYGDRITEAITGPTASATVKGNKNFGVVQAIYVSGALSGNVTVGSADECESQAFLLDYYLDSVGLSIHHSTSSSLTHRVLSSLDNLLTGERNEDTARWVEETGNQTGDEQLTSQAVIKAVRLEITSHVRGTADILMSFPGSAAS